MKKILAFLLVMALAVVTFTACGGKTDLKDSKYVGTWKCVKITFKDESGKLSQDWTLEIKDDGTGTSISEGASDEFTWQPVDGGFKTKGGIKATFKDDGDNIKTKIIGANIIFEKQ